MSTKFLVYVYIQGSWCCDGKCKTLQEAWDALNHHCWNGGNGKIVTNGMELFRAGSQQKEIKVF